MVFGLVGLEISFVARVRYTDMYAFGAIDELGCNYDCYLCFASQCHNHWSFLVEYFQFKARLYISRKWLVYMFRLYMKQLFCQ